MSSINRCLSGVIRDPLVWNVVTGITASSLEDASRPATKGHRKPPPTVAAQRRIPRSGLVQWDFGGSLKGGFSGAFVSRVASFPVFAYLEGHGSTFHARA